MNEHLKHNNQLYSLSLTDSINDLNNFLGFKLVNDLFVISYSSSSVYDMVRITHTCMLDGPLNVIQTIIEVTA